LEISIGAENENTVSFYNPPSLKIYDIFIFMSDFITVTIDFYKMEIIFLTNRAVTPFLQVKK
jgi:hypothetical protein